MLLDEWSSKELELARTIGAGRAVGAGTGGPTLEHMEDDPLLRPLGGARGRGGRAAAGFAEAGDDADFDPIATLDRLDTLELSGVGDDGGLLPPAYGRRAERGGGAGSVDGEWGLALDHLVCGGDGMVLSLLVDQQPARAWVDADAWCDWLRPRLPVQRVDQIPAELMPLLGEWALLPLQQHARTAGLRGLRFVGAEAGHCARVVSPTLTLLRDGATLTLRLLDWPANWIEALAGTMEDRRAPLVVPPIPMPLVAGWVRLTRSRLRALQPGDGIVLDQALPVEAGHAWLFAERPLARLRFVHDAWRIECAYQKDHPMQDLTDTIATGEPLRDEDIVLTAVAELGRMSLSLDILRDLHAGQVLDIPHASHGRVTLTVAGQAVATGTLLRVGERLVMRVE